MAPPAKKSPSTPAPKKKALPKALSKLATHNSTAVLLAKIKAKAKAKKVDPVSLVKKPYSVVEKKVGGEKNGGTRKVRVGKRKGRSFYPTEDEPKKKRGRHSFQKTVKKFKKGIEPGRVVILLTGRNRGKRVIVLKTLPSGLLLITGPWAINQCPLRRMHQQYVIVTSTKIDLSGVKIPDHINDEYFARKKKGTKKSADGSLIFKKKPQRFTPSKDRKKDQVEVDKLMFQAIHKQTGDDRHLLKAYLGSYFRIRQGVFPHQLKF